MILYFSFFTIVLCITLLIFNAKINRSIYYLVGYLICLALYGILHHLIFFNSSGYKLAIINIHLIPVYYLAGPMLFFYIRSTLKDSTSLSYKDLLHFIPFVVSFIAILPYLPMDFAYKIKVAQMFIDTPDSIKSIKTNILYPNYINVIFRPIFLLTYSIGCLYFIWKYSSKKRSSSPHKQKEWIIKWLTTLSITSVMVGLSYLLMTYSFFTTKNLKSEAFNQLPISIFTGIIYTLIPIAIIFFPKILYGIPRKISHQSNKLSAEKKNQVPQTEDPLNELSEKILEYFEKDAPYLDPDFNMQTICTHLDIPKHHVYYCLNNIIKEKFTDLRNRYRIDYAKKLLISDKFSQMTIEGIGLDSGFSSKSHFFAVFKELTGKTPFEYIERKEQ